MAKTVKEAGVTGKGSIKKVSNQPVERTRVKERKAGTKRLNNTGTVNEYMAKLEHPLKAEIEEVRMIIRNANSKIAERIKWNAPSFYYNLDMAAFNPRSKAFVQLIFVFYNGNMIHESSGLLEGDWKDRRQAKFYDMKDIRAKESTLHKVVNDWIALMEN